MKKITLCIICLSMILVFSGCDSKKVSKDDVENTAIKAISKHDNVKNDEIKIIRISENKDNAWTVAYQTKDKKYNIWSPAEGWKQVEIEQDHMGNLKADFIKYGI